MGSYGYLAVPRGYWNYPPVHQGCRTRPPHARALNVHKRTMKSNIQNQLTHTTLIGLLALLLFVVPFTSFASVIASFTTNTDKVADNVGGLYIKVGNGLSGTFGGFTIWGNPHAGGSGTGNANAHLLCFTDSAYTQENCAEGDFTTNADVVPTYSGGTPQEYAWTWTSSGYTLDPSHYYMIQNPTLSGLDDFYGSSAGSNCAFGYCTGSAYFQLFDSGGLAVPDNSTHVVSVTPADGATTTSPVAITVNYHINDDDAASIWSVPNIGIRLYEVSNGIYGGTDVTLLNASYTSGGDYVYSTTTPLVDGNYNIEVSLYSTTLWGFVTLNLYDPITVHRFVVGSSTPLGDFIQGISGNGGFVQGFTATSTAIAASGCSPASFQLDNCLVYLFLGNTEQWASFGSSVRSSLLLKFPWGYITRASDIVFNTASSSLPSLVITAPSGLTGLAGDSIDLTPWAAVASSSQYKATGSSVTWWSVISPYWDLACYSLFGASVFFTALGLLFKRGTHHKRA